MSDKANIAAAVLAHVDAGKTTLSEALLYESGMIRRAGRVDNKDAFLDTFALEKERGITIFSKQAVLKLPEETVTLLDTPGHVDFSAEMERTLQVLDYAILVISGADGVQAHTRTLFGLLAKYEVPVFLFVNKMDQPGTDQEALLLELKKELHENCVDFSDQESAAFAENVAVCDEQVLEQYLAGEAVGTEQIKRLIRERKLFPCYFGSALKMQGVKAFLVDFIRYASIPAYGETFGARVFKIARDAQGNRLTYLKVTGGSLKVRQVIGEEKINQIRIYSGEKYETAEEVGAGGVCAVTGLLRTFPGEGLGAEKASRLPVLEPVLTYQIILPEEVSPAVMLPRLRELEEEEPQLHIVWDETLKEIQVQVMGEVQIEVLSELIRQRYGVQVTFGAGRIVYKETIAGTVEGVGHFEPLRHYAEVHLLLEPGEPGSGLVFETDCSEDVLDRNWQRYHKILADFKADIISIQTAYLRLAQLEKDSQALDTRIAGRTPPLALNDFCYDQSIELVRKAHAYADAQHRAIALTRAAADPANLSTDDQEEQSHMLQAVMIRESPPALFIADEIAAIRDYLAIPEEDTDDDGTGQADTSASQ